jgi:hypothetical protein
MKAAWGADAVDSVDLVGTVDTNNQQLPFHALRTHTGLDHASCPFRCTTWR